MNFCDPTGGPRSLSPGPRRNGRHIAASLSHPTDFDRHVVAVVPRVVSAIEKVAEYASLIATGLSRTRT